MKITLGSLALAALAAASFARVATADPAELRMGTLAPTGSTWMKAFDKGSTDTAKHTESRVLLKYYPNGEQGDERDFINKMKLGQLDGAAVTSVGLSMIDESIRVLELPMMFESPEEVDYVADKVWPYFQKKFEAKGFQLEARGEVGWIHFLSKAEVKSLAELRKQKVWLWGDDRLVSAVFKKLGISGVALGVPEVDSALTTGRINACYGSPLAAVALQWHSKIRFMTSMRLSYSIGATLFSKAALAKLSADDAKKVVTITNTYAKKLRAALRKDNDVAQRTMTRKGVTVSETPADMVAEVDSAAQALWKEQVGKLYSKEELEMVLAARAEYRSKAKGK